MAGAKAEVRLTGPGRTLSAITGAATARSAADMPT